MGSYDYLLLLGALAALVLGFMRFSRIASYALLVLIGAWPVYGLAGKYNLTLVTGSLMVAIFFAFYPGLYWVGSRFSRMPAD